MVNFKALLRMACKFGALLPVLPHISGSFFSDTGGVILGEGTEC